MLRYMAAIANDGKAVSFNEVNSLASQAGKALNLNLTKNETQLLSTETAAQLKKLMRNNVKAQYGEYNYKGLHLCAKSGTAEVDKDTDHNTAWFVGFMDDADYPVCLCGSGGARRLRLADGRSHCRLCAAHLGGQGE